MIAAGRGLIVQSMHPVRCKCGSVSGQIEGSGASVRVVCYCVDCRAFARYLGRNAEVLDAQGGTEIVQVAQSRLRFSRGMEHLAAMRLSEKGMVRWYAACCKTPIGNTMANPGISFVGMIHASLDREQLDRDFGTAVAHVNTGSALGERTVKPRGLFSVMIRFVSIVVAARLSGRWRESPFFNHSGSPIVRPVVLTPSELATLHESAR